MAREHTMTDLDATMIAEGAMEAASDEEFLEAWQTLVDRGLCWQLQGYFGRTATKMIEHGLIMAADKE